LKSTTKAWETDTKFLTKLTVDCKTKALDFEARQVIRANEIKAIQKAVQILGGSNVVVASEKHGKKMSAVRNKKLVQTEAEADDGERDIDSVAQLIAGTSFAQLRGSPSTISEKQAMVAQLLQDQADKLDSNMLSRVAEHIAADPFVKVRIMINGLIMRMKQQAADDATKKAWCDGEITANQLTRTAKTVEVDGLVATIDTIDSQIKVLKSEMDTLSAEITNIHKVEKANLENRQTEAAANAATIKDSQGAQQAIQKALVALREFYNKPKAAALLQDPDEAVDDSTLLQDASDSSRPRTHKDQDARGPITLLDTIATNFASLEARTTTDEATAVKAYDNELNANKVLRAEKGSTLKHKTTKRLSKLRTLSEKKTDLKNSRNGLKDALKTRDSLKAECVNKGLSPAEKVARRAAEIASLKDALKLLSS